MKPIGEQSVEKGNFSILYEIVDDSFAHEFGTQRQTTWVIKSAQYYIQEIDKWIDADCINSPALEQYLEKIVENHYEAL
jgi:hypothetical protein